MDWVYCTYYGGDLAFSIAFSALQRGLLEGGVVAADRRRRRGVHRDVAKGDSDDCGRGTSLLARDFRGTAAAGATGVMRVRPDVHKLLLVKETMTCLSTCQSRRKHYLIIFLSRTRVNTI